MSIGSVGIPQAAVVLGTVTPPQGDVIDLRIHLGCTKEVSSFELTLQNWNKKYSPGGTNPILVGADGHIDVGRGTNVPTLITCRVENVEYDSPTPEEHYLKVTGRCWGERLFRSIVTKTYTNQKGEAVVKDLMDSFAGLSHNRSGTELIQNTSTMYTELDYEDTPLLDILKHIADTADLNGVIGYDFRVAPDGHFEFFPRNSKTPSLSLADISEVTEYKKDISRVRNKIFVYGAAEKVYPASMDLWTESLGMFPPGPGDFNWTCQAGDTMSLDTTNKVYGTASIYDQSSSTWPYPNCKIRLLLPTSIQCGGHNGFQQLNFAVRKTGQCIGGNYWATDFYIRLMTDPSNYFEKHFIIPDSQQQDQKWQYSQERLGKAYEYQAGAEAYWAVVGNPDWRNINYVEFALTGVCGPVSTNGWVALNIDKLFFDRGRYSAVEQESTSQTAYGTRMLSETDEELVSDTECDLRAKSLLAYWKDPDEYLKITSTVLDYGLAPIQAGDTIHATFPNENIDADYRVETVEYYIPKDDENTLEITFELGKVPPLLADYLYGLRSTTVTVEKLARTKLGVGQLPSNSELIGTGSGLGNHHISHEVGDVNGAQYSSPEVGGWDPLTGWIAPNFIGPLSDTAGITNFRTKNKASSGPIDHHFQPSDNEYGILGTFDYHWKELHAKLLFLYRGLVAPYGGLNILNQGDANPLVSLIQDYLEFGPGGGTALDTWLHRVAAGEIQVKNDFVPTGDNAGKIGYGGLSPLRWSEIHGIDIYASQFHWAGNLIPDADNTYDIGENTTPKRWRDLYLSAVGDLGLLNIGGVTVITAARLLQNVTADCAIITSGRFPLARLLDGTAGYVLEAEGVGVDPIYVNPNGRYTPAGHTHTASDLVSGVLAEARVPNVYVGHITFNSGITASDYKSSYGNSGLTTSVTYLKDLSGNTGILTFQNGLLTGYS